MTSRVVCIVQSRLGSSRLPGKALLSLAGRPLLAHVLERVRAVDGIDEVILATTWNEADAALVSVAARLGVRTWRGSEQDVLSRFREAARWVGADAIMRVTGDCPFFCADIGGAVLLAYRQLGGGDAYAWNDTRCSGYPDGTDVEVFGRSVLELADCVTRPADVVREHVTGPIRRLVQRRVTVRLGTNLSYVKLSVDRPCDLQMARRVASYLPADDFTWPTLMGACRAAGLLRNGD